MRVNQNTFVSENALLPGYVVTKYNNQQVEREREREGWILRDKERERGSEGKGKRGGRPP